MSALNLVQGTKQLALKYFAGGFTARPKFKDATTMLDKGPTYSVELLRSLPLPGNSSMQQAMPAADELQRAVDGGHERLVAAFEVLTAYYHLMSKRLHRRKCFDCGENGFHADSVSPYVRCHKCGSMDTRKCR